MLTLSSQVAYTLAIVQVVNDGNTGKTFAIPLLSLTTLFFITWQLCQWLNTSTCGLAALAGDLAGVVTTGGKLLAVCANALAWGVMSV